MVRAIRRPSLLLPKRKLQNTKIGSSSLSGESSRAAIARSSNSNTGYQAIRFTAASRICTLKGTVGKDALFSIDGHALWDFNDYDITVQLAKPNLGYIKAGYTEFRSWYDGNAGFFPHNDVFFEPPYPEMHVDRGDAWIELGLRAARLAGDHDPLRP